ncbi:MAG TPA: SIS domain-containing protein [Frankiaceae bacterium]|nr:SIS domain-containing protein [Frankiaceae bacterium]
MSTRSDDTRSDDTRARDTRSHDTRSHDLDALYPFLAPADQVPDDGGPADQVPDDEGPADEALLEQVRRSTAEKAREIVALREQLAGDLAGELAACAEAMASRFAAGGRLYCFGNGGSSTDAQAVATLFCSPGAGGRPLPAIALPNDVAVMTALANDVSFEVVFARQLAAFARPADMAFGLSTSGGSANVLRAFAEARGRGLLTVGLAGYDGGKMRDAGLDHLFVVPSPSVHRIQEAQTTVYDVLWELVQVALAG